MANSILKILLAKKVAIALCARTGRATKRLSESTGVAAKTIPDWSKPILIYKTGSFRRTAEAPLDCDLLVVNESSIVDVPLMRALVCALPDLAALLPGRDVDQLPSVALGI